MNCALHKQFKLEYFCQTCLDPVCQQCIKSNPHSNQFHKIQHIQTSVSNRKGIFKLYIDNQIDPLREKVKQKMLNLKQIQAQQLQQRNAILKDISLQFQAIEHRTKEKADKKICEQQTQIKYYQAYLNTLDDLAYTFQKTSQDPYNFLILYQDFNKQLKNLELKDIKQKTKPINMNTTLDQKDIMKEHLLIQTQNSDSELPIFYQQAQFPRQIKNTYKQLSALKQLQYRNQFMNTLIAESCQNYKTQQKKLNVDNLAKYKSSLHLFNQTNQQILSLNSFKSCIFCDTLLDIATVNDQCTKNRSTKVQILPHYSYLKIAIDFKGTKRHYWTDSNLDSRKVPKVNPNSTLMKVQMKAFQSSLKQLKIIKCCLRSYEIQSSKLNAQQNTIESRTFMFPFENQDNQKNGILSKIKFKYILTKTFFMKEHYSEILTELLSYNWQTPQQFSNYLEKKKQHGILHKWAQDVSKMQKQKPKMQEKIEEKKEEISLQQKQPNIFQRQLIMQLNSIEGVNYRLLPFLFENPLFIYQQFTSILEQHKKIQESKKDPIAPRSGYNYFSSSSSFNFGSR